MAYGGAIVAREASNDFHKRIISSVHYGRIFSHFTLCCLATDTVRVKQVSKMLSNGETSFMVLLNQDSAKDEPTKLEVHTDGCVMIEMIITSSSIDVSTKESACREILKYCAIDLVIPVLKNEQLLTDLNPSNSVPLSLPDPVKQLQYLRKMDFAVMKITIPKRYQTCKWLLRMKQAQVTCVCIENCGIVVNSTNNLAMSMSKFVYIKSTENIIEGVIKETEVEEGSYLIILGRQSNWISDDLWRNFTGRLKTNLDNEFRECDGFLVQQLLPQSDSTVTYVDEGKKKHEKSMKMYHFCQESSSGKYNPVLILYGLINSLMSGV